MPPELLYPVPGNDSPGFPAAPVAPPVQAPSPGIPGSQLNEWLLAHLLSTPIRPNVAEQKSIKDRPVSANCRGDHVSTHSSFHLSNGEPGRAQWLQGISSDEPMQFWSVQPPIFFPFG
jgi:hypothetical protein